MGKQSRRERLASSVVASPSRPRWASAEGFDYGWALSEAYATAGTLLLTATDPLARAKATKRMLDLKLDLLHRELATLNAARAAAGDLDAGPADREERRPMEPVFPSDLMNIPEDQIDAWIAEGAEKHRSYALSLSTLAESHLRMLRVATPILFDPLGLPEADEAAIVGLRLPFPVTVCDFLAQSGMSLPVAPRESDSTEWVGLVEATLAQAQPDVLDVWPVVTTLHARERDDDQSNQRTLMFGRARFGAELPDPPEGLVRVKIGAASVWAVDATDVEPWAGLWVVRPALAAASALRLLEAVNVSLEEVELRRPERRRMQREGGKPALEVVVRTSVRQTAPEPRYGAVDWQHRWTVRGHWKHFRRGPIFDANPRKRVQEPDGSEAVRVWCPPFVKGPEEKPLVLKSRRADHGLVGGSS